MKVLVQSVKGVVLAVLLCGMPLATAQSSLPEGEGKQIVMDVCTQCHSLDYVTDSNRPEIQWTYLVDMMRSLGAPLADDEVNVVVTYLVRHFGPAADASDE